MIKIQITAAGKTLEDLEYALEDIVEKFADGFTTGTESSAKGYYTFAIEGEEEVDLADAGEA